MAFIKYSWNDASAPVLNASAGSLIALLDACLVNGYGSKAAAGWTKQQSGTNIAVYRNGIGSSQKYVRITDTASVGVGQFQVLGYHGNPLSLTTTDFFEEDFFPNQLYLHSNQLGVNFSSGTNNAKKWTIFADEKTAIILLYNQNTSIDKTETSTLAVGLYLGDINSYDGFKRFGIINLTTAQIKHFSETTGGSINYNCFLSSDFTKILKNLNGVVRVQNTFNIINGYEAEGEQIFSNKGLSTLNFNLQVSKLFIFNSFQTIILNGSDSQSRHPIGCVRGSLLKPSESNNAFGSFPNLIQNNEETIYCKDGNINRIYENHKLNDYGASLLIEISDTLDL